MPVLPLLLLLFSPALKIGTEADVRRLLAQPAGTVTLPPGTIYVESEIALPEGTRGVTIRGDASGTTLAAAGTFRGRAVLVCRKCSDVTFEQLRIDGNRAALGYPVELLTVDQPFASFYKNNGILVEASERITMRNLSLRSIASYAVIVSATRGVNISHVEVASSGSLNAKHRNNASGGILLEEGTSDFEVKDCTLREVRGNGIWTHSFYRSPRNGPGVIRGNRFESVARDAILVGHATRITVEDNRGSKIGFPAHEVDIETGATPVGVDTGGNVDRSRYAGNRFEEVNGKCIDLDGFHDGEVTGNVCINRGRADDYPSGHFGIVVNNWNPDMQSRNITIAGNTIDGSKFGGIFLIGSGHRVTGNRLLNLNLARCNEDKAKYGCLAIVGEPEVLEAGIYLGRIAAEWAQKRADASRDHVIEDNVITGWKMDKRCIVAAPGVRLESSTLRNNQCSHTGDQRR